MSAGGGRSILNGKSWPVKAVAESAGIWQATAGLVYDTMERAQTRLKA